MIDWRNDDENDLNDFNFIYEKIPNEFKLFFYFESIVKEIFFVYSSNFAHEKNLNFSYFFYHLNKNA